MKRIRAYQVKEVSRIAGVSVRTLHHYDEIGLLVPATRSAGGYRLYDQTSLLRLQQILIGRELGLPLEEIRRSLDDPNFDHRRTLLRQREQLVKRAEVTAEMIIAVDRALAMLDDDEKGNAMTMEQIFDGFDPSKYEEEAEARWGETEAYRESSRRTKAYTAEDWAAMKDEQAAIYSDLAKAQLAGKAVDHDDVMDIAERHRLSIDRWFYPCSVDKHCGLADLYEADNRFAASIDAYGAGLTPFLAEAIRANARRRTGIKRESRP